MAYFGGGGVAGALHPSLQAYIDCFQSPPFPRMFPRGGGVWDQDPVLIRDFRTIRTFELQWKQTQEQHQRMNGAVDAPDSGGNEQGLEDMLESMLEERGLADDQYF